MFFAAASRNCEFYDHCHPDLAADHVSFLPRMRIEKVDDLIASGIMSVHQIPGDFPLSETQRRAVDTSAVTKSLYLKHLTGLRSIIKLAAVKNTLKSRRATQQT